MLAMRGMIFRNSLSVTIANPSICLWCSETNFRCGTNASKLSQPGNEAALNQPRRARRLYLIGTFRSRHPQEVHPQ